MAKMIALSPAIEVPLTDDWTLVASEAGRYGNGLRVTVTLVHEGNLLDPENLDIATGHARQAYAWLMANRLRGTSAAATEAALSTLFKAIEGHLRRAKAVSGTASTLDPATHPYTEQEGCLVWMKDGLGGPVPVRLTNFTTRLVGDVLYDDGAEQMRQWAIEATLDGVTRSCQLEASAFAGMTWVAGCLGTKAIVLPGTTLKDHARAAIQFLSDAVTPQTIYSHLGWREAAYSWPCHVCDCRSNLRGLLRPACAHCGHVHQPPAQKEDRHVPESHHP